LTSQILRANKREFHRTQGATTKETISGKTTMKKMNRKLMRKKRSTETMEEEILLILIAISMSNKTLKESKMEL